MQRLVIATRESELALWQARHIQQTLEALHTDLKVELLGMTTEGDRIQDVQLLEVGGKSLFVKELEKALLDERADIAVHSLKDVPVDFPDGLDLPVICQRADARDVLVSETYSSFEELPAGAKVGTSSLRRQSQLRAWRPDLDIIPLRGNVNTRLKKLADGEFDAIILAAAGLQRLEMADKIREYLPENHCIPAIGQGALAIECRTYDLRVQKLIKPLHDLETAICVGAERIVNQQLGGGCHVPLAAHATIHDTQLHLHAMVGAMDGKQIIKAEGKLPVHQYPQLGEQVAADLLAQGAQTLLEQARAS